MRKKPTSVAVAIILAVAVALTPVAAFAGRSNGPQAYMSTGAKNFNTYSSIQTTSTRAISYQFTRCTNTSAVAGEMGSLSRLYSNDSGALYSSSGWYYNGSTYAKDIAVGATVSTAQPKGTSWYANGAASIYMSGGYKTLSSGRTLNQTVA